MSYAPSQTWDIDRLYPGGPSGQAFRSELSRLQSRADDLVRRADTLPALADDLDGWRAIVLDLVEASEQIGQLYAYAGCAYAADATSTAAERADQMVAALANRLSRAWVPVDAALGEAADAAFGQLVASEEMQDVAPLLAHRRAGATLKLARPLQELLVDMDREALHGWGQLYDSVSGRLEGTLEVPGQAPKRMGIAALSGLRSHKDGAVREAAFTAGQQAWGSVAHLCAMSLTHITGARQTRYDRLGVDELATSLHRNRVTPALLDAMWAATDAARPALQKYLQRKAKLLGKPKLDWWDEMAPLPGASDAIGWDDAQRLVVDAFAEHDPELRDFAVHALKDRWIEAEARPGKQQGGFCTELPLSHESRIFLTFSDSLDSTLTLAHELGHAFHNHVLFDAPSPRREVTSALAETASTFAEAVVRDRALANASSDEVRRFMLDQQLQAGVAFLMNIPARFAFERELFRLRRQGPLDPTELSEVMVACQKRAYGEQVYGQWDPMFWSSKLHFYIAGFGFYNWPYAFGYLFSSAVYQRALDEGPAFLPTYRKLLMLTGYEQTEVIGREVLGEDLTKPEFWVRSVKPLLTQVDQFLAMTE